ncbi:helix-turn-helix domain-containing protein (plasmid) [Paraclostridium tenue]
MFKDRLKELRKKNKLSQTELAKVFNITQTALSRLETGETVATEEIIIKSAEFFNVSTDYLLCRTDIKNIYNFLKE